MYSKDKTTIVDRREMLRVKLASLTAESHIIRRQEARTFGELKTELSLHRRKVVRAAARETGLALGLIRGKSWRSMESKCYTEPDWEAIQKMLNKYGPVTASLNVKAIRETDSPFTPMDHTPRIRKPRVHKPAPVAVMV